MSEIFVSYKREDEKQVGRLVRALEGAGLSVWWDRGLPGGESWRSQIQTALDAAKCVIVAWTRESVGPAGDFVCDEAGQATRRSVLVPVMLERVDPPLGFGEIQAIDLTRWKGNPRDPFFDGEQHHGGSWSPVELWLGWLRLDSAPSSRAGSRIVAP